MVVVSNTHCPEVALLYGDATRVILKKAKAIGNAAKDPNRRKEYLLVMDPEDGLDSWAAIGRVER